MGDEDDGALFPLLELYQFTLHFSPDQRVQRGKRFIHQQDRRIARQRPCQADPLLHPSGQFMGITLGTGSQPDFFKRLLRLFAPYRLWFTREFKTERNVLQDAQMGHQRE
ncbi:hypothetical protein D9M69_619510 [compost metagenome]